MQLWMDELTITPEKLDERDFYFGKNGAVKIGEKPTKIKGMNFPVFEFTFK